MAETQVMASAISLALFFMEYEDVPDFQKELANSGVPLESRKTGVLNEQGGLHLASIGGCSSVVELHIVL